MTAADLDLRSTLTDQHRQVKTLMGEVLESSGDRQAIAELEGLLVNSDEFRARFEQLAQSVIAHAEAEEHKELPVLDQLLGEDDLIRIRGILEQVPELARQANATASFQNLLETAKSQFAEQV